MRGLPTTLSVIAILMAPVATRPEIVGFDEVASGTQANSLDLPGVAIASGVVLSETDAALLTGFDASGWASSGTNGLVNADEAIFEFFFDVPVGPVSVEVRLVPGLGWESQSWACSRTNQVPCLWRPGSFYPRTRNRHYPSERQT